MSSRFSKKAPEGLQNALTSGHYAQKQLFSRNNLIGWSHRRRFAVALELAPIFAGKKILDYGCGDGTFLALLMNEPARPAVAFGADADPKCVADCQARFAEMRGLRFLSTEELKAAQFDNFFDAIVCMEVLEHVIDVDEVLEMIGRLLTADGIIVVSVPVETGLPLLIKQTARRIAGWRGCRDYPGVTAYKWSELLGGFFGQSSWKITRPIYSNDHGVRFHDHKGFNWVALRKRLSQRFQIEKEWGSPVAWMPRWLASQVWFLGVKKKNSTLGALQNSNKSPTKER